MTPLAIVMLGFQAIIVTLTLVAALNRKREWLWWLLGAFSMMLFRRVTAVATIQGINWEFWDRQFLPAGISACLLIGMIQLLRDK